MMKTKNTMMMIGFGLLLIGGLLMIGCSMFNHNDSSPTAPGSALEAANFYTSRGLGTGEIGGYVKPGEFVLNLPAGDWRVTYTLPDGSQYTKYAVLDQEAFCYFGTGNSTVAQVEIEQGEFTDDGSSTPLSNAQRLYSAGVFRGWGVIVIVIFNGQVNTAGSHGVLVILLPRDLVYPPTPSTPSTTTTLATTTTTTLATTSTTTVTTTTTTTMPSEPCMVTNSADDGSAGSLRQVLADAGTNGCATITFDSSVGTITLNSTLQITEALTVTIDGGGAVTVSGSNTVRVLFISHGSADVMLQGITLTQGKASSGGGVYVRKGMLTLHSGASISNNSATWGGGVYVTSSGALGALTLHSGASISNNSATWGGGVDVGPSGALTLHSGASISNNTATWGGGVDVGPSGALTLHSGASISSNTANLGGGVCVSTDSATLNGTIAGNTASTSGGGIYTYIDLSASSPNYGSGNPTHADDCYAGSGGVCP